MSTRINSLDGLRGVSILLVLISHAGLGHIVPGGLGVTIFFFISGYIITLLLLKELQLTKDIDIKAFYVRRAFRILPALAAYLAACTLFLIAHGDDTFRPALFAALLNFYNYYYIFFDDHTGPFGQYHPYSIVWSLCIEEHYYLVFPVLLYGLWKKPKALIATLLTITVATLCWRLVLIHQDLPYARIYKASDTRIDSIIFGAVLALIQVNATSLSEYAKTKSAFAYIAGAGLIISLAVRNPDFRDTYRYTIQSISLLLGFSFAVNGNNTISSTLSQPILVFFGRISYSLYLWHWLVFVWLAHTFGATSVIANALMPPIAVGVSYLSHKIIETPFIEWLRRKTSQLNGVALSAKQ